jgi:metallophosphoesterase (TIGR03767 family)
MLRSGLGSVVLVVGALVLATSTAGAHEGGVAHDTSGRSTLEQTITGSDPAQGFSFLRLGPGEPYVVRTELAQPKNGRENRRSSLSYFAQLTDFQIVDEESPTRVEFADGAPGASSAWRPQEAMVPHSIEASIRQLNHFLSSTVPQGDGSRAALELAVLTGDLADNMQRNETEWVLRLLEGGRLDPGSGTDDLEGQPCTRENTTDIEDPSRYTGVQDYDDHAPTGSYYDPDHPFGRFSDWPRWPGLMDRAQEPFEAEGLKVPSYVLFGNHDALTQGTEAAIRPYEDVATGCLKPLAPAPGTEEPHETLTPEAIDALMAMDPDKVMRVPPDENRQFVDKRQFKEIFKSRQSDQHGFAHIDPDELAASDGAASYYAWSPKPGLRFISLDTVAMGGSVVDTANGNIDHPQWQWLQRELAGAQSRGELIVAFAHHATGSLTAQTPDEAAGPCTVDDEHGHDINPGCDRDPRPSTPLHHGDELAELFQAHPNVIAFVAGHSHHNRVQPFARPGGGGFWEIKSPSIPDWPPQHRLLDVMDNRDGTLSIFGTLLDHDSPVEAPPSGTPADPLLPSDLASIGRTITWNDPDQDNADAEGAPTDRNVELLLADPRAQTGGKEKAKGKGKG